MAERLHSQFPPSRPGFGSDIWTCWLKSNLKLIYDEGLNGTEVAFLLLTQQPQVEFPVFAKKIQMKNYWCCWGLPKALVRGKWTLDSGLKMLIEPIYLVASKYKKNILWLESPKHVPRRGASLKMKGLKGHSNWFQATQCELTPQVVLSSSLPPLETFKHWKRVERKEK